MNVDAAGVTRALQAPPTAVAFVLQRRDLLPPKTGFYAWWSVHAAISGAPHLPHPLDDALGLLYVGISPSRATSRRTIRSRVLANHLGGNISSSTFRFVLAALLLDELTLRAELRNNRYGLKGDGESNLRAWQKEKLRLTWCERAEPWKVEHQVIALMQPPLNSAGNTTHPFYARVRAARNELRQRANEGH
jgi:hypothetical protein